MKKYMDYVAEATEVVAEIVPLDLEEELGEVAAALVLDLQEPYEFDCMHIDGSHNVPRGVPESACEWDYKETILELVTAREREILVVCRSGHHSLLAAKFLMEMGYDNVHSLKTGL
jgi:rhodanese-related sulfurtransferase